MKDLKKKNLIWKYEYNDIREQPIANDFDKLKISYNTKIKPKSFTKCYHKFGDKFDNEKHWDREVYRTLKNRNNHSEDALYKYNLERKEIENRMVKNNNIIEKLKRGLNMAELDMDELNTRNLIQKKKNKDIKIREKMKNENEKKHLKYNPQMIESNMNDNDENENDENDESEEELTFEQKMDLHNKYCKLLFKID